MQLCHRLSIDNKSRRGIAVAALSLLCASGVLAEDLVVGVPLPMTGYLGPIGVDQRRGIELAAKHHPKVKGMDLKVVFEDTQTKADIALVKAQKLVFQDKAKVLAGLTASSDTLMVAGQAARLNVPLVTFYAQVNQITGAACNKMLFRTAPYDAMVIKATASLMKDRADLRAKKWFVVYHDILWGRDNKAAFAAIPGVKIVGEAGRAPGIADWASMVAQIQASGADGIYLAMGTGDEMPAFVRQAHDFGLKHVILAPVGMPDSMLQAVSAGGVGMVGAGQLASWTFESASPDLQKFNQEYFDAYKVVPGAGAIQGYIGMTWLVAGLERAKATAPSDLVEAFETTTAKTILGDLKMRKEDHQAMPNVYRTEAVKLDPAKYGAKVAWKVDKVLSWQEVGTTATETGCKGL
jgi:branched-chain amino acid transport system substrate-binding protein